MLEILNTAIESLVPTPFDPYEYFEITQDKARSSYLIRAVSDSILGCIVTADESLVAFAEDSQDGLNHALVCLDEMLVEINGSTMLLMEARTLIEGMTGEAI